jgi:hypothetical protein
MRAVAIVVFGLASSARADDPPKPPRVDQELYSKGARAIYRSIPQDEHFNLLNYGKAAQPLFPGTQPDGIEWLDCPSTATFSIIGNGNELGSIAIWQCEDSPKLRQLIGRAEAQPFLKELLKSATPETDKSLRFSVSKGSDGSEHYYFPILLVGHGFVILYTAVTIEKSGKAFVGQAMPNPLCDQVHRDRYAPICADFGSFLKSLTDAVSR